MKQYSDLITGAVSLLIGIALLAMSIPIGIQENNLIGAAFLPEIVSVIIIALSLKLVYDGFRAAQDYEETVPEFVKNYKGAAVMMAACILYAELLKPVGFLITSIVFLFLTFCLMTKKEETNYLKLGALTIVSVFLIYFIFTKFFGIRLPAGILKGII
ncbi:MAG TPA: hypothetical protein DCG51_07810 [Erysipelotrichaceae bacterium]|jgi:hypothetical protein|nr:tripartite tricarboxylate transporter TctB family protein [Solobacterium sp.]HAE16441.1 hypothetical protein [Erysipelotrichaceae bacterium]